jgi:hypothetical protein
MTDKYTLNDLVKFSIDQKPVEFDRAFQNVLQDKLVNAVETRKLELAQGIVSDQESDNEDIDVDDSDWEEEE